MPNCQAKIGLLQNVQILPTRTAKQEKGDGKMATNGPFSLLADLMNANSHLQSIDTFVY